MNRTIVSLSSRFGSLRSHCTVGVRHAVGRAIRLALIAVLVVDCVFWLTALDLFIRNTEKTKHFSY